MPLLLSLAAGLCGFGGLLLQVVLVRRHGLLLGNTSEAVSLVLALFLLGLGLGGLWLPRLAPLRRRPLAGAALLYAATAASILAGDWWLQRLAPQPLATGLLVTLVCPGLQALLMGAAFPLLFAALKRGAGAFQVGLLLASNLFGSVLGAFAGGNFGVPELGLSWCSAIAALAYALGALVLALLSRGERAGVTTSLPAPPLPGPGFPELAAALAGFLLLGLEVALLRRLPFFLDGFQPTLSGVVTACLLGLTLGAGLGAPLLQRLLGKRALAASLVFACVALSLGMHEWLARDLGRLGVGSDMGFHLRILAATSAAAGLPCFCVGATIPLALAGFVHPETRAPLAGRLFFCEGTGALLGALFAGHLLPMLAPVAYFAAWVPALCAPVLLLLLVVGHLGERLLALVGLLVVVLASLVGLSGAGSPLSPRPPIEGSRNDDPGRYRYLEHRSDSVLCASVAYNRRRHGMTLFTDEFRAAYLGPDSGYMKVLAHLPFLLRDGKDLRRVAVLALGTGTTANALCLLPEPTQIHVVEISPAVLSQADRFAGDGPAAGQRRVARFRKDPRVRVHVTDARRFVARAGAGSLDLISMEPLLPYAPGTVPLYTAEFYRWSHRALRKDGLLVQWVPTHSMPERFYRTLLATFATSFEHHSIWLCDQSTLLVGSKTPHLPELETLRRRLNALPAAARLDLHEAGLARAEDVAAAFVGQYSDRTTRTLHDDRPFLTRIGYWSAMQRLSFMPTNLQVLQGLAKTASWPAVVPWRSLRETRLAGHIARFRARLPGRDRRSLFELAVRRLSTARGVSPGSVLLFREQRDVLVELTEVVLQGELWKAPDTWAIRGRSQLLATLARSPDSAMLQLLLAESQATADEKQRSVAQANALDPTLLDLLEGQPASAKLVELRRFLMPHEKQSPLERLGVLPVGADLVAAACTPGIRGFALRRKFPVRVAWALIEQLGTRSLRPEESVALRETMDPALLSYGLRQMRRRGQVLAQFLPLWRPDLPLPAAFPAVQDLGAGPANRQRFGESLAGRKGLGAVKLMAELLLDQDPEVRRSTYASMVVSFGDTVDYDPTWPESQRRKAAQQLRSLHNLPR